MKKLLLSVALITMYATANAQAKFSAPDGGGEYKIPQSQCVSDARYAEIQQMLNENRKQLIEKGILSDNPQRKTTATKFDWPLKQATGFGYNALYGISNFVDRNVNYPGQIQDWNCGTRSYDLASGYNHAGMDIYIWPFDINMMDSKQAQIVAAAPGIITGKQDNNFDKNCAMGSGNWNAVYVEHADGTVAWYGHMKKGSLTSKNIGDAVNTGDVLGTVGSSGSSTGPHLHFEVHDAVGGILDPYNGTCNIAATMWNTQKPYYEPTINALMTHSAAPVFNTCPMAHNMNVKDTFPPSANTIVFAAYYHDQQSGPGTTYNILRPDGSVYDTWTHTSPNAWYSASWWYWTRNIPATEQLGKWKFEATYQSKTVSHDFYRSFPTGINTTASNNAIQVYPNPAKDVLYINAQGIERIALYNTIGQAVYTNKAYNNTGISISHLPDGMYYLHATINGQEVQQKITISK